MSASQPPNDDELRELIAFACELADASGPVILPHFREPLDVENKAAGAAYDPVTRADRDAEAVIRAGIRARHPTHGILGEEHGHEPGEGPWTWVIDPIDGTRAFVTGVPLWGTLIALFDGARPLLGVVDQPFLGERFVGSRLGAQLRSRAGARTLQTRPCARLEDAAVACTTPEIFTDPGERAAFDGLAARARLVRYGGDCYAYCVLALGFFDLVVESSLKPYDIQALVPIIEAAGGVVTTWSGGDPCDGGQIVAAGDPRVHAAALAALASGVLA